MILQNKEQFIRYIPTAAASDWRDMETFRDSAERWLKNEILGRVLYEELEADAEREQYQELSDLCCKVISLDAYHRLFLFSTWYRMPTALGSSPTRTWHRLPGSG